MRIRRFNESYHFKEEEILEDILVEYIDKYHLVDYNTIGDTGDFLRFWEDGNGWYWISNKYGINDKFTIYVKRSKVSVSEFYSDMDKLKSRLDKMGFRYWEKIYNIGSPYIVQDNPTFGYSLVLITKSTPLR